MVKQRLGEYRYGVSYWNEGMISLWGILGNLILALVFAIGGYFAPESYFFSKGMILNLVMAFCYLLPIPQLDALKIYFGSRTLYYFAIFIVFLFAVLLLTKTMVGLILAVVAAAILGIYYILIWSEK